MITKQSPAIQRGISIFLAGIIILYFVVIYFTGSTNVLQKFIEFFYDHSLIVAGIVGGAGMIFIFFKLFSDIFLSLNKRQDEVENLSIEYDSTLFVKTSVTDHFDSDPYFLTEYSRYYIELNSGNFIFIDRKAKKSKRHYEMRKLPDGSKVIENKNYYLIAKKFSRWFDFDSGVELLCYKKHDELEKSLLWSKKI